ncbi:MAG TPA: SPOR domain-containing protein [Candidatus Methylomirabilis sp.]|nr:SPOR domain-containing protein [Candidatus Methylomirabilis sp.]
MALGGAATVVLVLTFAFGLLVGRQLAHQAHPGLSGEPARAGAATPRRSGLTEMVTERPPPRQEKLTFYQTLTAPLGPGPLGTGDGAKTAAASGKPQKSTGRPAGPSGPSPAASPTPDPPRLPGAEPKAAAGERQEAKGEWTVQVGVFKSPQQADSLKKQLARGGFDAQITPSTGEDGQVRYRVRVGAFKSKEEAVRTADRVRSDGSVPTFVTER